MRLSLKESRMKLLNATTFDRKSGIRGPKTIFFECFHSKPSQTEWLNPRRMHGSEHLPSSLNRHLDITISMSSTQKSRFKLRRRQPNPLIKHGPMKPSKSLCIRSLRRGPFRHRPPSKEQL